MNRVTIKGRLVLVGKRIPRVTSAGIYFAKEKLLNLNRDTAKASFLSHRIT